MARIGVDDQLRSGLKAARTSSEKSCGCSRAAKWPPTIIKEQIIDDNGNGGNGSNGNLDVSIAVGHDPIVHGNIQTISTTVTDSQSENGISGAKIDGQVRYVTGHVERFSGNSNGDGKYEHQWRISGNAKTGIFQVKVDASDSGYGTASDSSSFRVIEASQTGLLSQPDPCLDNSTLTDCQPNPCEMNPDAEGCPPDPCDVPNPPPECEPIPPECNVEDPPSECGPIVCDDGSTVPAGEDCPEPPEICTEPECAPTECPDGQIVQPGEECPEEDPPDDDNGDGGEGGEGGDGGDGGDEGGGVNGDKEDEQGEGGEELAE
jgi:hypothetical protein